MEQILVSSPDCFERFINPEPGEGRGCKPKNKISARQAGTVPISEGCFWYSVLFNCGHCNCGHITEARKLMVKRVCKDLVIIHLKMRTFTDRHNRNEYQKYYAKRLHNI